MQFPCGQMIQIFPILEKQSSTEEVNFGSDRKVLQYTVCTELCSCRPVMAAMLTAVQHAAKASAQAAGETQCWWPVQSVRLEVKFGWSSRWCTKNYNKHSMKILHCFLQLLSKIIYSYCHQQTLKVPSSSDPCCFQRVRCFCHFLCGEFLPMYVNCRHEVSVGNWQWVQQNQHWSSFTTLGTTVQNKLAVGPAFTPLL